MKSRDWADDELEEIRKELVTQNKTLSELLQDRNEFLASLYESYRKDFPDISPPQIKESDTIVQLRARIAQLEARYEQKRNEIEARSRIRGEQIQEELQAKAQQHGLTTSRRRQPSRGLSRWT